MNLSAEEKELFFKVAKILQREAPDEDLLFGGENDFDGDDIALVLFEAAGYLAHPHSLTPELWPDRPRFTPFELSESLKDALNGLVSGLKKVAPPDSREFEGFFAGDQWTHEQIMIRKPEPWKIGRISSIPTSH